MRRMLSAITMPWLLAVLTVAATAAILAGPGPLPVAGGLLLGFALPGLALTEVLFRHRTLSPVERTVLAPALSLAVLVVTGMLLYVAGVALDRLSWTLAAAGVTVLTLIVAAVPERVRQRREKEKVAATAAARTAPGESAEATVRIILPGTTDAPTEMIPVVRDDDPPPAPPGPFAPRSAEQRLEFRRLMRQLLPMVLVLAVLAGAGYLSFVSSHESYDVTVTTLSAAPPGEVGATGLRTVEITASGLVAEAGPYTVRVTDPDGAEVVERTIVAGGDGTWTTSLALPAERMTVSLFRAGDAIAYRTVLIASAE